MLELKYQESREMDRHGSHYEDDIYTIGGYTITNSIETEEDGTKDRYMYVRITNRRDETGTNRYLPEIYFNDRIGRTPPKFTIQTTSYGALEEGEYREFLEAQHIALDVVTTLTDRFINE